ncbi:hypothetical protein C8046_04635 [Serinibacter arcticus]|uniref:D-alanyl-D-alanine carboxypeptidase-like core domain-containing protein n=1 Tax=Serinibacter arcticus TaxID=1655435 RepID=A0A2U1ZSV4_9MICO|nr:M15 family metallopeptidase [Serinibacter arcticus]PWD50064.1 hypothetical protein C8046_04635 [Serinibacter arcticus]
MRRRRTVAVALVLALIGGGTAAYVTERAARAERVETARSDAATAEAGLRSDLDAALGELRTAADDGGAVLAGTDLDAVDTPEDARGLANAGLDAVPIDALTLALADAQAQLDTPITVATRPETVENVRVDAPVSTTPSVTDVQASTAAVAGAVEDVRTARTTVATQAVTDALAPARSRLAQWEPIAADPAQLDDLRSAVAAAAAATDGTAPTDLAGLAVLRASLETATAAHPEVVTSPDAPTSIDGVPIVNKAIPLPDGYDPGLLPEVAAAFDAMAATAAAEAGLRLFVHSGYRSYGDQLVTYDGWAALHGRNAADRFSSRPGYSEHQSGLSLDVNDASRSFDGTPEALWVAANAHRFGFVVRYPEGKEAVTGYVHEPWHLRHLGVELATRLVTSGLTLEEHLGVRSAYAPDAS